MSISYHSCYRVGWMLEKMKNNMRPLSAFLPSLEGQRIGNVPENDCCINALLFEILQEIAK